MLVIIGLGLWDEKDITLRGLEEARASYEVFLEAYTSRLFGTTAKQLEAAIGKPVKEVGRDFVEGGKVLEHAKSKKICLLVAGDPLVATTHTDLILRAKEKKIPVRVIHNASVMNAVADTGLQPYKFGRSATVAQWEQNFKPSSFYDVLAENRARGLHTFLFLDIKTDKDRYMTANEAIAALLLVEAEKKKGAFTEDTEIVVCARLGSPQQLIRFGRVKDLAKQDFGKPLHALVVPGALHEMERKFLESL
jgi:diphthine synthase